MSGKGWRDNEADNIFTEVEGKLAASEPKKAYKLIDKWIKRHEGSEQMDRALFLKSQSLYDRKSYYSALEVYEQLLEEYGASSFFEPSLKQEMVIAK